MSLAVRVDDPVRDVRAELHVESGQTVAIVGPNGAGKSTVLETVAGLLRPEGAHVTIGEQVVASATTWTPAHRRAVALLTQSAALFPHLTVRDNVAFGPRSRGRGDGRATADRWLADLELTELADRRPAALSGGQAQRVAVARALAGDPEVVCLDEPMAALDVTVVPEVRRLLARVLADRTAVIVTHDPLDALVLADRTVVMQAGRVVDTGPTRRVLAHPRSTFGAALAGVNLVPGTARGPDTIAGADGFEVVGVAAADLTLHSGAYATFAPSAVSLHRERPQGSARNVRPGVVESIDRRGPVCRIDVGGWLVDVTPAAVVDLGIEPGAELWMALKATEVAVYPA